MMSDRPIEGFWYLPGREDEKLPGVLEIYQSGDVRLRLFGWLFPEEPSGRIYQEPEIIFGRTLTHGDITLVDCFVCSGPIKQLINGKVEILKSEFGATAAHFGRHIDQKKKLKTSGLRVSFSQIGLWRIPARFEPLAQLSAGNKSVSIKSPKNRILYQGKEFSVVYTESVRRQIREDASFYGLQPFLEIRSPRKKHLDEFRTLLISMEAFLSFVSRARIYRTSVAYRFGASNLANPWVSIHGRFAGTDYNHDPDSPDADQTRDVFFTLGDVYNRYQSSLGVWLDNFEEYFPVYVLYLSSMERNITVDQTVFALAQASEAYYKRITKRNFHLNRIIKEMVQNTNPKLINHIGSPQDFGNKIKDIRHYYAHYDRKKTAYPFTGSELIGAQNQLRLVLEINILKWMKLSNAEVRKCLKNVWAYGDFS